MEIRPGIGFPTYFNSYSIHSEVNEQTVVIKSVELVLQIVYKNESFIVVQLTIPTPIPLIGSTIACNEESIQLIMTRKITNYNNQIRHHDRCIVFVFVIFKDPQPILQVSHNGLVQLTSPCKNIRYHLEVTSANVTSEIMFIENITTYINRSSSIYFSDYIIHLSYQVENNSFYHPLSNITLG